MTPPGLPDKGPNRNDGKYRGADGTYLLTVMHASLQPDRHCPPQPPSQSAEAVCAPETPRDAPEHTNPKEGTVLFAMLFIRSFRCLLVESIITSSLFCVLHGSQSLHY